MNEHLSNGVQGKPVTYSGHRIILNLDVYYKYTHEREGMATE
jgi:hypothetical protein